MHWLRMEHKRQGPMCTRYTRLRKRLSRASAVGQRSMGRALVDMLVRYALIVTTKRKGHIQPPSKENSVETKTSANLTRAASAIAERQGNGSN